MPKLFSEAMYLSGQTVVFTQPVILLRNEGLETAHPIKIGDNVWFGGNVVVLPGISIGNNTVIGAGSVITKDIPDNVVAVGNPCRIVKNIDQ